MVRTGIVLAALGLAATAAAAPIPVRVREGVGHAFMVLSEPRGAPRAWGESLQAPRGAEIETRLVFRFDDGSLHDETLRFTQDRVFRLETYHLVQRGPSFPEWTDVQFDRGSGRYRVRYRKAPDADEETHEGVFQMPADLGNGMASILLKNLPPGRAGRVSYAAFTPKPRILQMELQPEASDTFRVGPEEHAAVRYKVDFELGGLTGAVATLVGRDPPAVTYWLVRDQNAPALLRFEGPIYATGPTWRVEVARPRFGDE